MHFFLKNLRSWPSFALALLPFAFLRPKMRCAPLAISESNTGALFCILLHLTVKLRYTRNLDLAHQTSHAMYLSSCSQQSQFSVVAVVEQPGGTFFCDVVNNLFLPPQMETKIESQIKFKLYFVPCNCQASRNCALFMYF